MIPIMGMPVFHYSLPVSYVSIGEWQVYGELMKQNESRAILELVYYSLHRASGVTRRKARWLVWRHRKTLTALIELICEISLPKIPDSTGNVPKDEAARNIKTVYRVLSRMHGWTPKEISDMSPAQVYSYLCGGADGTGIMKRG